MPAIGAVVGAAAKAAAKGAAKAAATKGAKKASGGSTFGLLAVVAGLLLIIMCVPVGLIGVGVVSAVAGANVTAFAPPDPDEPSGPGANLAEGVIPSCAVLREVGEVDGSTANANWSAEQLANARTIIQVGMELDWKALTAPLTQVGLPPAEGQSWPISDAPTVPVRAVQISLMTAMQESSLVNLNHDDDAVNPDGSIADGGGLFQQQVSQGWGTWEQVTDPEYATARFMYGLSGVDGWAELEPWQAAHEVQGNRYASDYQRWWEDGDAATLLSRFLNMEDCATWPLSQPYNMTSGFGPRDTGIPGASRWHPAWDFANGSCVGTVYAMRPGVVTMLGGGAANNLGVTDPDTGAELQYLHMSPGTEKVSLGDTVEVGQELGPMSDYGVGGCHLDLRIYAPRVLGEPRVTDDLVHTEDLTEEALAGYVHPQDYASLFGLNLCPEEWCTNLVE